MGVVVERRIMFVPLWILDSYPVDYLCSFVMYLKAGLDPEFFSFPHILVYKMALKCTPDIGNHLAHSNHRNHLGMLYSLKGFKGMFAVANHQANDLTKTGTSEKEKEND